MPLFKINPDLVRKALEGVSNLDFSNPALADFSTQFTIDPNLVERALEKVSQTDLSLLQNFDFDQQFTTNGSAGNDKIFGGRADNIINGFSGNDKLFGRGGDDLIRGGNGNDVVNGGSGDDRLFGGSGDDRVIGGNGDDRLNGNRGDDLIVGGRGDDIMRGGLGDDTFRFNPNRPGEGDDIIRDFELGSDKIQLSTAAVLASTPGLLGEDGVFQASDLDDSLLWTLTESDDGNLVIGHPNGTIELESISFDESLSFEAIFDAAIDLIA